LQFDKTSKWLAVSSDKQTIHLFVVSIDKGYMPISEENAQDDQTAGVQSMDHEEKKNQ
jgi:hypothetical protein